MLRLLFVIKERKVYGVKSACYGLVNSCEFVARTLRDKGIIAKVVQVVDNNAIDKEVFQFKPTHCYIEALWVVPCKFKVLANLHPTVKWVVRLHSMVPFLVSEGMSFDWINEYHELQQKGINIAVTCNNKKLLDDLENTYPGKVNYTPNIYYPSDEVGNVTKVVKGNHVLNIGCFGALRLLKNHCQQAFWAIKFADSINKSLYFHVNVSEHETNETSPVLKNIRAVFKNTKHTLVEHTWMPHSDFLQLVKQMDLGLQITFTETFNIVAADFVHTNVPVVVSDEIDFVSELTKVNLSKPDQVIRAMKIAYHGRPFGLHKLNNYLLNRHNKQAAKDWYKSLGQ